MDLIKDDGQHNPIQSHLGSDTFFYTLLNAMPTVGLVLNEKRQILFYNRSLELLLTMQPDNIITGKLPGEVLSCVNKTDFNLPCGTTPACQYCDLLRSVTICQQTRKQATNEIRFLRYVNNQHQSNDFKVTTTPFTFQKSLFMIVIFEDISSLKRQQVLETIFFHDIINSAGALLGLTEIFEEDPQTVNSDNLKILSSAVKKIYDEIQSQKLLSQAETKELALNKKLISIRETFRNCITLTNNFITTKDKFIRLIDNDDLNCETDPVILERIILNLLKNATEAVKPGVAIICDYKKESSDIIISINNPGLLSDEIRYNIFKRSFSTKGTGRGIGTYSVKLLTEQYLNGIAYFTSTASEGTTFFVKIPQN